MKIDLDDHICDTPRFMAFRAELGCTTAEALGLLVMVWLASRRDRFVGTYNVQDFKAYLPAEAFLSPLIKTGFIHVANGYYEILGNAAFAQRMNHLSKAGKAGHAKMAQVLQNRRALLEAEPTQPAAPAPEARPVLTLAPTPGPKAAVDTAAKAAHRRCWEAYEAAFIARWHVKPHRNRQTNACLAQFVARVGHQEAPEVMRFYLAHNDSWYVRKMHPINLALQDAEPLRNQWMLGRPITQSDVRQMEKTHALADQIRRLNHPGNAS